MGAGDSGAAALPPLFGGVCGQYYVIRGEVTVGGAVRCEPVRGVVARRTTAGAWSRSHTARLVRVHEDARIEPLSVFHQCGNRSRQAATVLGRPVRSAAEAWRGLILAWRVSAVAQRNGSRRRRRRPALAMPPRVAACAKGSVTPRGSAHRRPHHALGRASLRGDSRAAVPPQAMADHRDAAADHPSSIHAGMPCESGNYGERRRIGAAEGMNGGLRRATPRPDSGSHATVSLSAIRSSRAQWVGGRGDVLRVGQPARRTAAQNRRSSRSM